MHRIAAVAVLTIIATSAPMPASAGIGCTGECDTNGVIDAVDVDLLIEATFNDGAGCDAGDFNGDHSIGAADAISLARALTELSRWLPLPPLAGGKRQEHAVAALDDEIYVVGGFLTPAGTRNLLITDSVERFDVTRGVWEEVAPLPLEAHHVGVVASGGKLYSVGGLQTGSFIPIRAVYEYDPNENRWTRLTDLPQARGAMAVGEIDGRIYAVGGLMNSSVSTDRHEVYDIAADEWTALMPLPSPRDHLAAGVIDGLLYVVGGRTARSSAELDRYDPETGQWEVLTPMPTARGGLVAAVVNDKLVVAGGEFFTNGSGVHPDVEIYDPATNEWTALEPMAVPRHGMGAAAIGNLMYVPGGGTRAAFAASEYFDALCIED